MRSDQWPSWTRSSTGRPISSAMTTRGTGIATSVTKSHDERPAISSSTSVTTSRTRGSIARIMLGVKPLLRRRHTALPPETRTRCRIGPGPKVPSGDPWPGVLRAVRRTQGDTGSADACDVNGSGARHRTMGVNASENGSMASDPSAPYLEPARELPVIGTPDVLVVGGGSSGVAAAVASARRGAETLLIEATGGLGGLATAGLISLLLTLDDGAGTQVVAGLCQGAVDRLDASGDARYPSREAWGSADPELVASWRAWGLIWGAPPEVVRYSVAFDPEAFADICLDMLEEAGARLRLHTWFAAAPVSGSSC